MKRVERKASQVRLRPHAEGQKPFSRSGTDEQPDQEVPAPALNPADSLSSETEQPPAAASQNTPDIQSLPFSQAKSENLNQPLADEKPEANPASQQTDPRDRSLPEKKEPDSKEKEEKNEAARGKARPKTGTKKGLHDLIPSHQPQMTAARVCLILLEEILLALLFFGIARYIQHGERVLPFGYGVLILNILRIWLTRPMHKVFDFLFKWRWLAALIVFAILVALQIHMSNAGSYSYRFTADPSVEQSVLLGTPRVIRTDEYSVQLPYYFSQYYNDFKQISHQMSVGGQDMIVGYNSPVWSPTLIGKPFTWGYLLFGNTYGLSWYFCSKTILMFMVGLEMFMILCRRRYLSLFGAFILTFAPGMQWWFSPHFYDVIFWACTLFVVGYWFFRLQGWKKWAMTLLAVCSLTGFVLALFPSLQVPCGILMLCLMCACLWRDRDKLVWKWSNLANILAVLAGVGAVLGPALWQMREPIRLLMETEYPGSRVSTGGSARKAAWMYFINPVSLFQVLDEPNLLNNSEISSYTHFGVACFLFYPYLWWQLRKQKNRQRAIGDVLWLALLIEGLFLYFEIPEWLAKATLLSMCNRMQTVYGLSATIFTVWTIHMVRQTGFGWKKTAGLAVCVIYAVMAESTAHAMVYPNYIDIANGPLLLYAIPLILAAAFWLIFTEWNQLFLCLMICWTAFGGCMVNPIMQGTASVTDYKLLETVHEQVAKNPDAWWLTTITDQTQGLLMANGAKVINGVNFYPDYEKWKLIDPQLKEKKVENRYAHIEVNLTSNKKTTMDLVRGQDLIHVELAADDLKKLGVTYIVGNRKDQKVLDQAQIPYRILGKYDMVRDAGAKEEDTGDQDIIFQIKGA